VLLFFAVILPLSGNEFSSEFLGNIKKLDLSRVFGTGHVKKWDPMGSHLATEIFGDESESDESDESDESNESDDNDGEQEIDDQKDDITNVTKYPPFIGADVILTGLTTHDGAKLKNQPGKITGFNKATKVWKIELTGPKLEYFKEFHYTHAKSENIQVIPQPQTIDPDTKQPIENLTSMSLKYGVGPDGYINGSKKDPDNTQTAYKLVDPGFIDYIEELIKTMQETGNQFNFETIEQDMKESSKPQHCAACSKRLTDPSIWSRTVNIDKKNGEFLINSYHIKCMYNAPFKV